MQDYEDVLQYNLPSSFYDLLHEELSGAWRHGPAAL